MANESKQADPKKKILPEGVEQLQFSEYKKLRDKEIEKRNKKKQAERAMDKIIQIILILLAIPCLAIILYLVYLFLAGNPVSST